jgi:PAS domain S-box-containing protein
LKPFFIDLSECQELEQAYSDVLARKLDKKVRELETERERLKRNEEKYRRLVEVLRGDYFFYTHDTVGVFTYVRPSITNVLGCTQAEFLVHYSEYLSDNPINTEAMGRTEICIRGEKQPPYEVEVLNKGVGVRLLEVTEEPLLDRNGKVSAVEGRAHDITKRKNAEEQLRRTQESLQRAQQMAHIGNWDWDVGANELWLSDETYSILGLQTGQRPFTYESYVNLVDADDRDLVQQAVDRALGRALQPGTSHHLARWNRTYCS